jgi:hypothetical protein
MSKQFPISLNFVNEFSIQFLSFRDKAQEDIFEPSTNHFR